MRLTDPKGLERETERYDVIHLIVKVWVKEVLEVEG